MNNIIANVLRGYIDTLSWKDKTAGLVQTANVRVKNGTDVSEKSYPISCSVTYDAYIKGGYHDLAPDSKKKSVMYFEDKGVAFVEKVGKRMKMKSNLRLVGWLNLCLINDSCGTSGSYVIDVIKSLPATPIQTTDFIAFYISGISQVERSVDIFSKYTYNEQATQYLMYPFDYFALDLEIDFMIPCLVTPSVIPPYQNITIDNDTITIDSEVILIDAT